MLDKNQKLRYSKAEMELIESIFKDDVLVLALRNVFFQFEGDNILTEPLRPEVISVLRKTILPDLTPDVPIGMQADIFFSLSHIKEIPPNVAFLHIKAQDLAVKYLEERFAVLSGGQEGEIKLKDLKSSLNKTEEERFITMFAYLILTNNYIESCLSKLQIMAGQKKETPEEEAKRVEANSSK